MQNVPNIVRERLQAVAPPANHPDADVLTAFAEQSLSDRERTSVLEHLAHCPDCRDIVALALPATEDLASVVCPSPNRWLTWPALRWGFVAAGVVAIASIGILRQRNQRAETASSLKQPASVEVAANEPKKEIATFTAAPADKNQKLQTPAAPAFTDSLNRDVALDENENKNKKLARAESPARTSGSQGGAALGKSAGSLPHGPRLANQWQQSNIAQNQSPMPMPPSAVMKQDSVSVNGRLPGNSQTAMQTATLPSQTEALTVEALAMPTPSAVPPSSSSNYALARVDKAKPAVNSIAANAPSAGAAAAESGAVVGGMPRLSVPGPRWEVTAAGTLQRSFDQGASWQAVDVDADSASATSGASLEISAEAPRAKKAKQQKEKEQEKDTKKTSRDASALTFRTVAATGSDVWAGGSAGMLYHSVDSGNHWVRVIPISSGSFLTGDILSLEFSDPQHGKISTSTPETWITANAGQTWQKQ